VTMRRIAFLIGILVIVTALGMASATAQAPGNRAGLVVRYGDGSHDARCVTFSEASITGEELLRRSGLNAVIDTSSGQGGVVCSINGSGCAFPQESCFCQCFGAQCEYWAYYHWSNGQWEYSSVGASLYDVANGALEGWSWGPGNFSTGTEPPLVSFDQVCGATATPTSTATATAIWTAPASQQSSPPDGTFEADQNMLNPGSCTVLRWAIFNATQVTLNGTGVLAQDRKEVCPATTQRYTLSATNPAGTFTREVAVNVTASAATPTVTAAMAASTRPPQPVQSPTQRPAQDSTPQADTTALVANTPALAGTASLLGMAPAQATLTSQATTNPAAALAGAIAAPDTLAGLLASQPTPVVIATAEPRRQLDTGGYPTPTPILLAQVVLGQQEEGAMSTGPRVEGSRDGAATAAGSYDRTFRPGLLMGYAAFLIMAAILLLAGAWAVRRRQAASTTEPRK